MEKVSFPFHTCSWHQACFTTLSLAHGNGVISGIRALLNLLMAVLVLTIRFTTGISNGFVPGTKATCVREKGHKLKRAKSEWFQIVSWFSCPRQFLLLLRTSRAKSPSSRPFFLFGFPRTAQFSIASLDLRLKKPSPVCDTTKQSIASL